MKIYSNKPIPDIQPWKDNLVLVAINKKENTPIVDGNDGDRYEADMVISNSDQVDDINAAIALFIENSECFDNLIYGFNDPA